jgi:hypothetical protein
MASSETVLQSSTRARVALAAFVLGSGLLGALFELAMFAVSPHFYSLGGYASEDHPRLLVVAGIGFFAALPLGTLVGGLGLWLRQSGKPLRWGKFLGRTAIAIVAVALPLGGLLVAFDPFDVRSYLECYGSGEAATFLAGWGLRGGVYLGTLGSGALTLHRALRPSRR